MPTYIPETAEFDSAVELHTFGDGWRLLEVSTSADLGILGRTTHNCVGPSWFKQLLPGPEDEREALKESFRTTWDTPTYREQFGDEWVEAKCAGFENCPLPKRYYKIFALVDEDSKAHAAVILGEKNAVLARTCTYASYDDLGQKEHSYVTLDDFEFVLLQATYGISWMPEDVAQHVAEWWKEKSEGGDWNEEAFQAKLAQYGRYNYASV